MGLLCHVRSRAFLEYRSEPPPFKKDPSKVCRVEKSKDLGVCSGDAKPLVTGAPRFMSV